MFRLFILIFSVISLANVGLGQEAISPDLIIRNAERSIEISSQLCKVSVKITVENVGKNPVSRYLFTVEPRVVKEVAYISAQASDPARTALRLTPVKVQSRPKDSFWALDLKDNLLPGKTVTFEVEYVVTDALTPHPTAITQKEKQLVKYVGNHYIYSPYRINKQTTTVSLGTRNVESYTKLNPVSISDTTDPMVVHYENNSPFLRVIRLERVIEVSHWGNIAVEETVDMVHVGATLSGPFSRYEFQRESHSGLSSVKSFKTILPAAASDIYYRDDIGNISTSHMRLLGDSVELDLRPRFPLFGGWKTHYVLGYNVPSYEYLYNSGDNYKLKMRVIDHIFDDMAVDELVTRVILPEGSNNIHISSPYPVKRLPDTKHSTYLDTKGRPVITITKNNLVENHIQDFELDYEFPKILMLQEPLLVVVALYILFIMVIIYVRLDFSISKDEVSESRMRVSGLLEKLLLHQDNRANTYSQLDDQLAKLKTNKDVNSFSYAIKNINQEHKTETTQISELLSKVKPEAPEIAEKISELQKLDKYLKDVYGQKQSLYVEKLVPGKIGRTSFVEAENALNKKKEDTIEKINIIMKTLH
ncbi:hypothetical protein AAG570_001901 [Ranatra chinensis]|uniref:Dolichyl-diphosphooligosaccharide--protein glycosyltransferase subunit 1 n=1 Tax=Ranatra chinensis TaxID=642074 RepID=A0ABD0YA36_9HEMI